MKKFVIWFLLVASLVLRIDAAAVRWNSGTPSDGFKDAEGNSLSADMNYSIRVMFYDDAVKTTMLLTDSSALKANSSFGNTTSGYSFNAGVTYYVQAIVENDSYVRSTEVSAFTMPGEGNVSINFTTGSGLGGSNTWGDWTEKGGDVPEPTTCSLLLVGLAGMGLKKLRKRNKKA